MYFEVAKKQAYNYAENALCYRCISRNLAKIYKTATLTYFFWCMQSKSWQSTHLVMFFNPLMLVRVNEMTHMLKQTWNSYSKKFY